MLQPEIRCVEFVEQITAWLDGGLTDEERLLFEEHLAFCNPCARYVDQFRDALRLMREREEQLGEAPPPAIRSALLAAFRAKRA